MMRPYRSPLGKRRTVRSLLERMRGGDVLVVSAHGAFLLHSGDKLERRMAERMIGTGRLEPGGDALFGGDMSQTWRWPAWCSAA